MFSSNMLFILLLVFPIKLGLCSAPTILEHPTSIAVGREEPATLRCQTTGDPEPTVTWVKDGDTVTTAPQDINSHRVLLPAGSLFFLRVEKNRKEDDTGTYWCVATNVHGEAVSSKAKLDIAFLKPKFHVEPKTTWVLLGESVTLHCSPPTGFPPPAVSWTKDNRDIDTVGDNRYRIEDGNLLINGSLQSDQGGYQCVASNTAAIRTSQPGYLSVYSPPYVLHGPEDRTVDAGQDLDLECIVGGEPPPTIQWQGPGGTLWNKGSYLKLQKINKEEEGEYVCRAGNSVGNISVSSRILVQNPPRFQLSPQDQRILQGSKVSMECSAETIDTLQYWIKEETTLLLQPTRTKPRGTTKEDRVKVSSDGRLEINSAQYSDEGYYFCILVGGSGANIAAGKLSIKSSGRTHPPIIELGPVNQSVFRRDEARLHCQFSAKYAEAKVLWLKDGIPIELKNSNHFSLFGGTSLLIAGVEVEDSGVYTCQIKTSSGQSSASATLTVLNKEREPSAKPTIPDLLDFPGSPGKPRLVSSTNSSLTVGWSKPVRVGRSPLRGYQVEYCIAGEFNHWVTVDAQEESYTVDHLTPSSTVTVLVRARNENGLSPPSLLSDPMKLYAAKELDSVEANLKKLSGKLVEWNSATVSTANQVIIKWNVLVDWKLVDGFYLYFWKQDMETDMESVFISGGETASYTVTSLPPNTRFTGFLLPHTGSVFGRPSSLLTFSTKPSVPQQPPSSVELRLVDATSALVSWKPPPVDHLGGDLLGFKVGIMTNNSLIGNFTLEPGSSSLLLNNLSAGNIYSVKLALFNSAGIGPYSDLVSLKVEPDLLYSPSPPLHSEGSIRSVHEIWFISFLATFSILTIVAVVFIIYLQRRKSMSKLYAQYSVGKSKTERGSITYMEDDTLWINPKVNSLAINGTYHETNRNLYINSVYPPEYAELEHSTLSTVEPTDPHFTQDTSYLTQGPCYASTDLMDQSFTKIHALNEYRSGEDRSGRSGEDRSGSTSSSKSSGRKSAGKRLDVDYKQHSGCNDDILSAYQCRPKLCYSVGNSPFRRPPQSTGQYPATGPFTTSSPYEATGVLSVGPLPGLPPLPPHRGPSSYQGVRAGSLHSFSAQSPRYLSNRSAHRVLKYSDYSDMDCTAGEGRARDQYESIHAYNPTSTNLPGSSTGRVYKVEAGVGHQSEEEESLYAQGVGHQSEEEESLYAQSHCEDTQMFSNNVDPVDPGNNVVDPYSSFKPQPHQGKVLHRKQRMERRMSDTESRTSRGQACKAKDRVYQSAHCTPAIQDRVSQSAHCTPAIQDRVSQSAHCTPAMSRRYRDKTTDNNNTRVCEDINDMVEKFQGIKSDLSELSGRTICLDI